VLRQVVDFTLLCAAVVLAMGGIESTLHPSSLNAPLFALPLLVMGLFHLRGLYRTRLRALVLDGVVPVVSGVSVAAMVVVLIGLFSNGRVPDQSEWVRRGCSLYLPWGLGACSCRSLSARRAHAGSWASPC